MSTIPKKPFELHARAATKGPWRCRELHNGIGLVEGGGEDDSLGDGSRFSIQMNIHNARVAAAAPEFADAAEDVLDYAGLDAFLDSKVIDGNDVFGIRKDDLLALRAALRKARGQA